MNVNIIWTLLPGGELPDKSYGSVAGVSGAFTLDTMRDETKKVLGYRLTNKLPGFDSWEREYFRDDPAKLKTIANDLASKYVQRLADHVTGHPAVRYIDNATQFLFPAQLCGGDCPFYGGTGEHDDILLEKHVYSPAAGRDWIVSRPDGRLLVDPGYEDAVAEEWATPTATLGDPASARFWWTLETALQQVPFMHCG